jgi:hypothetical protein
MRTARSITSGENFGDFLMLAPFSSEGASSKCGAVQGAGPLYPGEHDDGRPLVEEQATWSARTDPFSSYRAGFEIRSYRLCRWVLMFHDFPELGDTPCLVRSTDFVYSARPRGA